MADSPLPASDGQTPAPPASLTLRAAILAVGLTFAIYLLTTRPGFIRINWVPYTSPPVQPWILLLVMQGLNSLLIRCRPLARRIPPLSRAEMLFVFAALCMSMPMERGGYVIHYLATGKYFANEVNKWQPLFNQYPSWFIPHDERVLTGFMEGAASGRVPWEAWRTPLIVWFGFEMVLVFSVICLVGLFRRQWSEGERLTYPMLFIPLEITGGRRSSSPASLRGRGDGGVGTTFFRNPYMWAGFGLAAAFDALNITHAFIPSIPGLPWQVPLDPYLGDGILRFVKPLYASMGLEIWGLAYLVSGEVLLSGWFFFLFMEFVKVVGMSMGYRSAGFPFFQEVSAGGYFALAASLIWVARPHLRRIWEQAKAGGRSVAGNEPIPARWLLVGLGVSTAAMVLFWMQAGLPPILPLAFLLCMFVFTLVAARVRAEAGPPVVWCHPYGYDQTMPLQLLGSRFIRSLGGDRTASLFGSMFWIGRVALPHQVGQYAVDGFQLAHHANAKRTHLLWLMLLTGAVGIGLAFWYHLDVGYTYGQALIGSRSGERIIGWAFSWSTGEYELVRQGLDRAVGPDFERMAFYAIGFLFTGALSVARARFTGFPFHPLGFLMATLYGDFTPYWFPFLFAWTCQRLFLRYGGLRLYRRFVPLFLGLTMGHVLVAGFLWRIVINYFIDPSISQAYYVNLGG